MAKKKTKKIKKTKAGKDQQLGKKKETAREKMIGQSIGYRYDVNLLPDYTKITPFLKKYVEAMGYMPSVFPPMQAETIEGLGQQLGLNTNALRATIDGFNAGCQEGEFKPTELDGLATSGVTPAKTNWARPIVEPPFYAYELRPGVTFTYLGLKVDETAQVQSADGAIKNLWAAGEIMAGSILGQGYLAGFGMTIGTVFGRLAGKGAADYVR